MKLVFWKSLGMAVTDAPLPPHVLATLKKTMQDDMHSLKYVAFAPDQSPTRAQELSDLLSVIDVARNYSLNFAEFCQACRQFCLSKNTPSLSSPQKSTCKLSPQKHLQQKLLPVPKPGLVLFRRDSRRRGSCRVVSICGESTKVRWLHNGKFTTIALQNLRNRRLFSLKRIFEAKTA